MRIASSRIRPFAVLTISAALVISPRLAAQQKYQYLGPNECLNCHDHQPEKTWYEKQEIPEVQKLFPQKGSNAGHINALKQLEAARSNDYAKAIGLKDKYDLNGACVRCHATVFSGDANAGVSCEKCHGPASGYLKVHQTKGAYDQSVAVGMTKLVGNLQRWALQCTTCHVMDDKRLIAAGHPSGDDFDLGAKSGPVALHFKKKYSNTDVAAIGRAQVQELVRKRGGGTAVAAAAAPAPAPAPPPVAPPPAPAPAAAPQAASNPPAKAAPPPAPAAPPTNAAKERQTPPAPPAAAKPASPPPAPATPPSPPAVAVAAVNAAQPPPVAAPIVPPPAVSSTAVPASLSAAVALVQGRLVSALTDLLQRGAALPVRTSTPVPSLTPYAGPDAELLQLQREAISLAIEALGTAPVAPPSSPR